MRIGSINSYNLNNFNCCKPKRKALGSSFAQNTSKFGSLNKDTVSFTGIIIDFQKIRAEEAREERGEDEQDDIDFENLQLFIKNNDNPNIDSPFERAMEENNINRIKHMFKMLHYQEYKDILATQILQKINYDLSSDDYVGCNYDNFISIALNNMSQFSKQEELSRQVYDEIANGILTNLLIKEPAVANKFLENIDNISAANLMMQKNDEGEYPIGITSVFGNKNKITVVANAYDGEFKQKKVKLPDISKYILRQKALRILEDKEISQEIKLKIKDIYKPNQREHSEEDEAFRQAFKRRQANWR